MVLVPEAEALVGPFRSRYDPSAAEGMGPHITLLVPFKPPGEIGADDVEALHDCFARIAPFGFSLGETRRLPSVLYLAPEPAEPFRRMTLAIWERYPERPPYEGRYPDIVPHLCVAQIADEQQLDQVAEAFAREASGHLPVRATATEVALMDTTSGRWQMCRTFRLGRG